MLEQKWMPTIKFTDRKLKLMIYYLKIIFKLNTENSLYQFPDLFIYVSHYI